MNEGLFWALVVGGLLLAELLVERHPHFGWDGVPGFYGVFGFVAFYALVLAGKHLRKILMREEDYYDR